MHFSGSKASDSDGERDARRDRRRRQRRRHSRGRRRRGRRHRFGDHRHHACRVRREDQEARARAARGIREHEQADKDRIALLEKQLAAAEALAQSPEQGLEKYKEVLAGASQSLERLGPNVPAEQLDAPARRSRAETPPKRNACSSKGSAKTRRARLTRRTNSDGSPRANRLCQRPRSTTARRSSCSRRIRSTSMQRATWPSRSGDTAKRSPYSSRRSRSARRPSAPSIRTWRRASTTWRCSTMPKASYAKAEPLYQQALAITKKALGPEHPDVATSLNNLAVLYRSQGLSTPRPSRSTSRRSRSGRRPSAPSIRTWRRASTTWRRSTMTRASTPRPSRSTSRRWRSGRRPSAPSIRTWRRASTTWRRSTARQGHYAKAEPLYQQALAITKKALGPEHPRRGDEPQQPGGALPHAGPVRQGRAALPAGAGDPEEGPRPRASGRGDEPQQPGGALLRPGSRTRKAEPLYQQALAIRKKALGPEHPDVATSLNNLAALYASQGQYAKAEPLYQQALAIRKKALGPEHPDVAESLENYADLLTYLKRDKEAANLRVQAAAIRVKLANR